MSKLRTALLAAATAVAALPTLAPAQTPPPDQNGWQGRDGRGDGNRGGQQRGAPPQAAQQGQPGRFGVGRPDGDRGGEPGRRDGNAAPNDRGFNPGARPDGNRTDGPGGQRGFSGRDPGGNRGDDRGPGGDWNRGRGDGWDRQPGWDRGRDGGYARNGGPGFGDRNGFNNWRGDRRYDWRGWRDQHRELFRGPRYAAPRGYSYRPFARGYRLDPFFYSRNYWIDDPYAYRLPPAGGYYRWVRYFDDVLLVDLRTGTVVDVINQFFW